MSPDQYLANIELKPGMNTLLIKVGQNEKSKPWEKKLAIPGAVDRFCRRTGQCAAVGPPLNPIRME